MTYYKIVNPATGKVLDITGGSTTNGAALELWTDNGGFNQHWQFLDAGGGLVKISNLASGEVLEIKGAQSTANGTLVDIWDDNGGANQHWQTVAVGGGPVKLLNPATGKVLEIKGGSATADGTPIDIWDDNGGANQRWQPTIATMRIRNGSTGKLLIGQGAMAEQYTDRGTMEMRWQVSSNPNNTVKIVNVLWGTVLDLTMGTADGSPVTLSPDTGIVTQQWQMVNVGINAFTIINPAASGRCLQVQNGSTADGAIILLSAYTGAAIQQWQLL